MSTTEPTKCRFRLDDTTSATVDLPDGRKLGYAEHGSPKGHPIINIPGFPGARGEGTLLEAEALELDARIITVDRPGYGLSTAHPQRTMESFTHDIDALTTHLDLPHFGVLGISGGCPYALACAHYLPSHRVTAVAIVCGLGSPDMGYAGMRWQSWAGWTFVRRLFPQIPRWYFGRDPGARLDLPHDQRLAMMHKNFEKEKSKLNPKDALIFGDEDFMRVHLARSEQVYAHGLDAMSLDFKVLNSDFGFRIEDVRKDLPVRLWYGSMDYFVPLQHGRKILERLGGELPEIRRLILKDGETHASISQRFKVEYLGFLVECLKKADANVGGVGGGVVEA